MLWGQRFIMGQPAIWLCTGLSTVSVENSRVRPGIIEPEFGLF